MAFQQEAKNILFNVFQRCKVLIKTNRIAQAITGLASLFILREFGYYFYRKYHHLPPGPTGYPIFGVFFALRDVKNWDLKIVEKYGPVIHAPVLTSSIIFVGDASIIKQLFPQKDWLMRKERTDIDISKMKFKNIWSVGNENTMPLIYANGKNWTRRRKHIQSTLFRTMTNKYVGDVLYEVLNTQCIPYLNKLIKEDKLWHPRELCEYIAFNTIFHTMFGYQIDRESQLYKEMITDFDNTFNFAAQSQVAFGVPFMRLFKSITEPVKFTRDRRNANMIKLIETRYQENKNNDDDTQKTYIDYTHQLVIDGKITQNEEIADTYFLFVAGIDTTSSTLDFGIVLLAKYVNIQQKVRNELLIAMGSKFNLKFVHNCPLFRAMIHEILRLSSIVYRGVNHVSMLKDEWINVDGKKYKIPKGTMVYPNIDYIHIHNKKTEHWKNIDGDKIFLENFLSLDKKRFVMNESFIGFGVGRRDCVGRQLAMKELQFVLGVLIMKYKFTLDKPIENVLDYRKGNMATIFMKPDIGVKMKKLHTKK